MDLQEEQPSLTHVFLVSCTNTFTLPCHYSLLALTTVDREIFVIKNISSVAYNDEN